MNGNETIKLEDLLKDFFQKNNIRENMSIDVEYSCGNIKIDIREFELSNLEELEYENEELKNDVERLEDDVSDLKEENRELENKNEKLENKIGKLEYELELKEFENEILEEQSKRYEYRTGNVTEITVYSIRRKN